MINQYWYIYQNMGLNSVDFFKRALEKGGAIAP